MVRLAAEGRLPNKESMSRQPPSHSPHHPANERFMGRDGSRNERPDQRWSLPVSAKKIGYDLTDFFPFAFTLAWFSFRLYAAILVMRSTGSGLFRANLAVPLPD